MYNAFSYSGFYLNDKYRYTYKNMPLAFWQGAFLLLIYIDFSCGYDII